jgi:hypothetical protein
MLKRLKRRSNARIMAENANRLWIAANKNLAVLFSFTGFTYSKSSRL